MARPAVFIFIVMPQGWEDGKMGLHPTRDDLRGITDRLAPQPPNHARIARTRSPKELRRKPGRADHMRSLMPLVAPVTMATFPSSLPMNDPHAGGNRRLTTHSKELKLGRETGNHLGDRPDHGLSALPQDR